MMFIHEPDFGACFSHVGKRAKRVKGSARAMAKPSMPAAGPSQLPDVPASTNNSPTMGAVQEKDTSAKVNAMRKMDNSPLVDVALLSTLLAHDEGRRSSNHPKNDRAKTTSSRKKKMLNTAFVARLLSVCAPKSAVMSSPSAR